MASSEYFLTECRFVRLWNLHTSTKATRDVNERLADYELVPSEPSVAVSV